MTDRELLQQALDALISVWNMDKTTKQVESIQAIKARLAQPEPEGYRWEEGRTPPSVTYTAPQKKEWIELTDEDIKNSMRGHNTQVEFARAIEAKLKEKNSE